VEAINYNEISFKNTGSRNRIRVSAVKKSSKMIRKKTEK